ncbi:MAG: transposase [Desulfovibrio sp.]|nr:transposase [Desulfovibrio sp.]
MLLFFLPPYSPELNPDELLNTVSEGQCIRQTTCNVPRSTRKNAFFFVRLAVVSWQSCPIL